VADDRLRNRLLPGIVLLDDKQTWDPVIPLDLNAPPPVVSAEGTAACEQCRAQFPLGQLEITAHGYRCSGCATSALVAPLPANLSVGRGRWWLLPIIFAVGGAFVLIAPAVALISTVVMAAVTFQLFIRRGL
jgi:hypothetical protein